MSEHFTSEAGDDEYLCADSFEQHSDQLDKPASREDDEARTQAVVKESARLYEAENLTIEESEGDIYAGTTDVFDKSDKFAKANLDVLHEAALRAAEMQNKE